MEIACGKPHVNDGGDPNAVRDFADHQVDTPTNAVGLADAQFVVARKSGFSSWLKLVHYVVQLRALEGTWLFTSLEIEGSGLPAPAFSSSVPPMHTPSPLPVVFAATTERRDETDRAR
jgi:hypothetical protein